MLLISTLVVKYMFVTSSNCANCYHVCVFVGERTHCDLDITKMVVQNSKFILVELATYTITLHGICFIYMIWESIEVLNGI